MKPKKMFVAGVLAAASLLLPAGLRAQGNRHCSRECEKRLLGSFILDVNVKGIPPFKALLTFIPRGGVIETNKAQFSPVTQQPTPVTVHGNWEATDNDDVFALTFMTLGLAGPGMAKTRETVTLSESGDSFTAVFQTDLMDADGHVVGTFFGTATAKRIFVEPLGDD